MPQVSQSHIELEAHLGDHLGFLERSAEAFDSGHHGEAKRLAVSLRVLFHDTAQSHSLLGQLNRLGGKVISSAIPHDPGNISTHGGLVMMSLRSGGGSTYFAPLDDVLLERWLTFHDWWNEAVFVDDRRAVMTRRDLVLAIANQDGGAHVDPKLSETYARLSRHNSLGWVENPGAVAIPNAERAAIRQIAHEALKTLRPRYRRKPVTDAEIIVGGAMVHEGTTVPPLPRPAKIGRNDPCPCGSGQKFKKCHGAI